MYLFPSNLGFDAYISVQGKIFADLKYFKLIIEKNVHEVV